MLNSKLKTMASAVSDKVKGKRNRVLLGQLPEDFLRINVSQQEQQEAADRQVAIALQQYASGVQMTNSIGLLNITIVQAKLTKNYGMVRMDPYCRIRVGHDIKETQTATNGGKNPRWNKVITCLVPQGIFTATIEIYDERAFVQHELIAYTEIGIPPEVFKGETTDKWYCLSGKQGEGQEGAINLVLSFNPGTHIVYQRGCEPVMVPRVDGGHVKPLKVYRALNDPNVATITTPPVLTEADLKMIQEMFPNVEKDVIKSVCEANGNNKDGIINSLLQIAD